jgi:hypothetical protein
MGTIYIITIDDILIDRSPIGGGERGGGIDDDD